MLKALRVTTMLFGLAAFAVGVWRQLETGTSPQAVWFGLVTGGMAVTGALLLPGKLRMLAWPLIVVSLIFVSGWFLNRALSGHAEGLSARVVLILVFCAAETVLLLAAGARAIARKGGTAGESR